MFNLENAISTWKRGLQNSRAFLSEDIEELERHVRDHVEYSATNGLSLEQAYRNAIREIGDPLGMEDEYRKVFWEKVASRRGLLKEIIWEMNMFAGYVRIAVRNLWRNKGYTSINILGLSTGLACFLIILMFVRDEMSFDRHHENADRIVRVLYGERQVVTPTAVGPTMHREMPEVESFTRIYPFGMYRPTSIRRGDLMFEEARFFYGDSTTFDVFSFDVLAGDPARALNRPGTVVLTNSMAVKYFGTENPMGQTLLVGAGTEYEVTAVIEDLPLTSHLQFDFLASFASTSWASREIWNSANFYTYLLLAENATIDGAKAKLDVLVDDRRALSGGAIPDDFELNLQPLTDIRSIHEGRNVFVFMFSAIGLLILLIACANYTNLATARAARRAREVGIRKLSGAHRGQLARQFFGESALLVLFAMAIAAGLVGLAVEPFNNLSGKAVVFAPLSDPLVMPVLLGLGLLISLIAGSYPALMLASFQPAKVLKNSSRTGSGSFGFRKVLVIFQFSVTVFLLAGMMIVRFQMSHIQDRRLGFDKENVIVLTISDAELRNSYQNVKNAFLQLPEITNASAIHSIPGYQFSGYGMKIEGQDIQTDDSNGAILVSGIPADQDVVETLGLTMIAGRAFNDDPGYRAEDGSYRYLVNESLLEEIEWEAEDAIGRRINLMSNRVGQIVGVYEDYHYVSLHSDIGPQALFIEPGQFGFLMLKTSGNQIGETIAEIERVWKEIAPGRAFVFKFLDDEFDALYRSDRQIGTIISIFSILAVFIACLGLLGLASYSAEQRTKEIGIRKALGANVAQIFVLMTSELARLVAISVIISVPFAWYVMSRWLDNFAYQIELAWWIFALAGVTALTLAVVTVTYQSVKAALADPIHSLRYE